MQDTMIRFRSFQWAFLLCLIFGFGCRAPELGGDSVSCTGDARFGRSPILLLAAASTTNAVHEVVEAFETETGIPVTVSSGASNGLAQQIVAGAPADVYLSANEKWAEFVDAHGLVRQSKPLLTNRIVLIVPRGNPAGVEGLEDLTSSEIEKVAIAGKQVPAGIYTDAALETRGLLAPLTEAGKIVRGKDVRMTLSYVEQKEAEAGIVYASDAKITDHVEVVEELPTDSHPKVVYPLVLLEEAPHPEAARKLIAFFEQETAAEIFRRWGFEPWKSSSETSSQPE
jgi:molybdate transport system substrate-binding protein